MSEATVETNYIPTDYRPLISVIRKGETLSPSAIRRRVGKKIDALLLGVMLAEAHMAGEVFRVYRNNMWLYGRNFRDARNP